jgi:hypothetical protein
MPIVSIELTDTLDQWRQKDNQMIAKVNSLSAAGDIISSSSPIAGQTLVFDGTMFRNVTLSGDVSMNSAGVVTVSSGGSGTSRGRIRFVGSMSSLY